jgi:dipeptidase
MCDTFVALGNATADGSVLLAKNADTEINEAQHLVRFPRRDWGEGAMIRTTHRVIPQVPTTWDVVLNKSFWTYGAEIGFNEWGVACGNEAVFTNQHCDGDGVMLIDHLRLMLERARNCDEAVDVIAGLLAEYGQGGNCELRGNSHFDGGFIVSDMHGAVEIQTAGRHWAVRRVADISSISNVHSIRDDWDRASLEGQAGPRVDFRAAFTDEEKSRCTAPDERQQASFGFLARHKGRITVRTMADLLRYTGDDPDYHPMQGERPTRICMHAAPYENRFWQATGGLISVAKDGHVMGWANATSGPDASIMKPVFCGVDLPDLGPMPRETFTPGAYWWKHERLHRRVMADYKAVKPDLRAEFDALEDEFFADGPGVMKGSPAEKQAFVNACWRRADEAADRWLKRLESRPYAIADTAYRQMWERFNRAAALTP